MWAHSMKISLIRMALNKTELKLDLSFLEDRSYTPDFTYRNFELDIFDIKYEIATKPDIHQFKPDTRLRNFQNLLLNIFQPHPFSLILNNNTQEKMLL